MTASGYYSLPRGWMDDPVFGSVSREEFCHRAAWAWIVSEARWRDGETTIAGKHVMLKRGQLACSLRYMGAAWGWGDPKVRRFLDKLRKAGWITVSTPKRGGVGESRPTQRATFSDAATDAGLTLITVCNYDVFQPASHVTDAVNEERPTQRQIFSDAKQNKERTEERNTAVRTRAIDGGPSMPALRDPAHRWAFLADGEEVDDDMVRRPVCAGFFLDLVCQDIAKILGISDPHWRADWRPVVAWLKDGLRPGKAIYPAIMEVVSRPNYQPGKIRSLAYFDQAVRSFQSR